jgi:hypothetical protein
VHCTSGIFLIVLTFLALGGCRTRFAEGTLRSQTPASPFEIVSDPGRFDSIEIPSFPLRVAAKFILSGIHLAGEASSPDLKYARFLQMLEYLDQYARLDPTPIRAAEYHPNAAPTYRDWKRAEHLNLPPFARFDRELRALLRNPQNHSAESTMGEVIPPPLRQGRAAR